MTDAEINRRVAEAAGYDVIPSSSEDGEWNVWNGSNWVGRIGGEANQYNPRHDANQAIQALKRVFEVGWEWEYAPANSSNREHVILDSFGAKELGCGPTFCAAACNAILAAKEKS